jgi:recombination protein RecA
MALHAVANAQKLGGVATYVDAEHALDVNYAMALGVDIDLLLLSQPMSGEEGLSIAEVAITKGQAGDIVIVDSVAALVPQAELDGAVGDSHMGAQARMMGQALRKITALAATNNVTVVFINQLRQKIGVMFGNPETTSGGNALKFYASCRIDVRRISSNKVGEEVVSNRTKVKVAKNKVSPPFKTAEFDIRFGVGIDRRSEILDYGEQAGVLTKTGSWYVYGDAKIANGHEAAINYLVANPVIEAEIYAAIRAKFFPGSVA